MKSFSYLFKTWGMAILLHSIIFMLYAFWQFSLDDFNDFITGGFYISLFSIIISIPAFLINWFLLHSIIHSAIEVIEQFIIWFFCVWSAIILSFVVLLYFVDGAFSLFPFQWIIPALIASAIALLARWKSFIKLSFLIQKDHEALLFKETG
jgi:hypothetical protein